MEKREKLKYSGLLYKEDCNVRLIPIIAAFFSDRRVITKLIYLTASLLIQVYRKAGLIFRFSSIYNLHLKTVIHHKLIDMQ